MAIAGLLPRKKSILFVASSVQVPGMMVGFPVSD
jgi:hypothetical protein